MSSHWAWAERVIAKHNAEKPFAPENGQALKFAVGDKVTYTNSYGVTFVLTVTGFYRPDPIDTLYATGCRYTLDWSCPWMPVPEHRLTMREDTCAES